MCFVYLQPFNFYDDIHMNHGSDVTATSSHSSEFEEERRLKPEVKFTYYYYKLSKGPTAPIKPLLLLYLKCLNPYYVQPTYYLLNNFLTKKNFKKIT